MKLDPLPSITLDLSSDSPSAHAQGTWQVYVLGQADLLHSLEQQLQTAHSHPNTSWNLSQIQGLDHIGALLFWRVWGYRLPERLQLAPSQQGLFDRLGQAHQVAKPRPERLNLWPSQRIKNSALNFVQHIIGIITLIGQVILDCVHIVRHPRLAPWREISANIYRTGYQALLITALVGCLIGIVLSYLSAQQLRNYGGDVFLVNLLGMSIIRELGPLLAAILVAGRSGSSITAQLGVMRVTEELDAMRVMGIPRGLRLITPKVIALAISMPLIVIWTDVMALIGGMISAHVILDMSPTYFLVKLPDAVELANFWIGMGKGCVFGMLIALIACHYGLRIKPNTESLGQGTTSSVVVAITTVILADALFAVIFDGVGF